MTSPKISKDTASDTGWLVPDSGCRQRDLPSALKAVREQQRPVRELGIDLRKAHLTGAELAGIDLSHCDLSGAELSDVDLSSATLVGARLVGATLFRAKLRNCNLMAADLRQAVLNQCDAEHANFGHANLTGAQLFEANLPAVTLVNAKLHGCDLRCAHLRAALLRGAELAQADLSRTDLAACDLEQCRVDNASFTDAKLDGARVRGMAGYETACWIGTRVPSVDFCGAYLFRRFLMDQNYLHEFRSRNRFTRIMYWLWLVTSDCGRSFVRWSVLTALIAIGYGFLYTKVSVDFGDYQTTLSPYYYSLVTLTTLGYGDAVPASMAAQLVAMSEALLGYVLLGGLLSILSNKLARRAD